MKTFVSSKKISRFTGDGENNNGGLISDVRGEISSFTDLESTLQLANANIELREEILGKLLDSTNPKELSLVQQVKYLLKQCYNSTNNELDLTSDLDKNTPTGQASAADQLAEIWMICKRTGN